MSLPDLWAEVGDRAGAAVLELFEQLRALGVDDSELERALSMLIVAQNLHAGAAGEAVAHQQLTAWDPSARAPAVPATELSLRLDRPRLGRAVSTVLGRIDPADLAVTLAAAGAALHRLGRSEAVATAQESYQLSMSESEDVGGWTRELEPDACELCVYWYASGREWTKHKTMPKHTGCTCAQAFHPATG